MTGSRPNVDKVQSRFLARSVRAALACALGTALIAVSLPARAGSDDDSSVPFDTKAFRGVMHWLGLQRDGDSKGIVYQERPPLVIPPDRSLPPPEKSDAVIANNPAWPKNQEAERAKAQAKRDREAASTVYLEHQGNPLSPTELTPGPKNDGPKAQPSNTTYSQRDADQAGRPFTPSELGYKGGMFKSLFNGGKDQETTKFTAEPPRTALTDPPAGYQTPSPTQPYGVSSEKVTNKAVDYYGTHGTSSQ